MSSAYREAPSARVTVPAPFTVPAGREAEVPVHWTGWVLLAGGLLASASLVVGVRGGIASALPAVILLLSLAPLAVRFARRPRTIVLERVGGRVIGLPSPLAVGGVLRTHEGHGGSGRTRFARVELWLYCEGEERRFVGGFPLKRRADAEAFAEALAALGGYELRPRPLRASS